MKTYEDTFRLSSKEGKFPKYKFFTEEKAEQKFEDLFSSFDLLDADKKLLDNISVKNAGRFRGITDESSFQLSKHLKTSNIIARSEVHIYYLNSSRVYEFKTIDVDTFFDDIFYPGANDIMISDEALTWMVYVDHDCGLYEFWE